jgi:hypothetical protein
MRQGCLLCAFNTVLEFLARAIGRNKRDKSSKGKSQTIPVCRSYDPILKKL